MQHRNQRLQDHLIIPQTLPMGAFSSSSSLSLTSASSSKYSEINFNPTSIKNCTAQLEILIKKWKAIVKMQQENENINNNNQNKNNYDDNDDENEQIKVAFMHNLSLFADTLFPRALTSSKQDLDSISLYHQQLAINNEQSSSVLNDEKYKNSSKPSNGINNNKEDDADDEEEKMNDGKNEEKVRDETSSSSLKMFSKMKSAFLNIATIFNEQAFFLKTSFSLLGQMIEYFTTLSQHHQHNKNNNLHHVFLIQTKVTRITAQLLQFVLLFSSFERNNNFRNIPIVSTLLCPSSSSSSSSSSGLNSILQIVVLEVKKLLQGVHLVSQSMLLMVFDEDKSSSSSLMSLFSSLTRTTIDKNENKSKNNNIDETFNVVSFKRTELEATLQKWFDQMFDYISQIIQAEIEEYKNSNNDDDDDAPYFSKNLHLVLDILSKITSLSRKNDELHHYVATRHHETTENNNNFRNTMMIIDINSIIKDNVAPLYNLCNSAEVIAMIACEGNDARTRQLLDFNRRCEEIMNLNLMSRMKEEEFKRKIMNEALMMKKEGHHDEKEKEKEDENDDEHSPSPILFTQQEVEELLEKQSQYNANEIKILKSVAQDLRKRNSAVKKQQD